MSENKSISGICKVYGESKFSINHPKILFCQFLNSNSAEQRRTGISLGKKELQMVDRIVFFVIKMPERLALQEFKSFRLKYK